MHSDAHIQIMSGLASSSRDCLPAPLPTVPLLAHLVTVLHKYPDIRPQVVLEEKRHLESSGSNHNRHTRSHTLACGAEP